MVEARSAEGAPGTLALALLLFRFGSAVGLEIDESTVALLPLAGMAALKAMVTTSPDRRLAGRPVPPKVTLPYWSIVTVTPLIGVPLYFTDADVIEAPGGTCTV